LYGIDGRRTYRTGDFGSCREGVFRYHGRRDLIKKVNGNRFSIIELEQTALDALDLTDACVVVKSKDIGHEQIILFIAVDPEEFELPEAIDALRRKLPSYLLPAVVLPFRDFPLLPSGKPDRWVRQAKSALLIIIIRFSYTFYFFQLIFAPISLESSSANLPNVTTCAT